MKIVQDTSFVGTHRTGSINGLTAAKISKLLGFKPNMKDDPSKVVNSWQFRVDGKLCAVWDYRGSQKWNEFSTYGDHASLQKVFGDAHN